MRNNGTWAGDEVRSNKDVTRVPRITIISYQALEELQSYSCVFSFLIQADRCPQRSDHGYVIQFNSVQFTSLRPISI